MHLSKQCFITKMLPLLHSTIFNNLPWLPLASKIYAHRKTWVIIKQKELRSPGKKRNITLLTFARIIYYPNILPQNHELTVEWIYLMKLIT